jgi:predicted phage-related endonuclease
MATPRKATPAVKAAPARRTPVKKAAPEVVEVTVERPVKLDALETEVAELRRIERQIKRLNDKRTPLIATVKERMGDATQGLIGGKVAVRWSTSARRTIDPKALREKYPDAAAACERVSTVRKFELIEPAP